MLKKAIEGWNAAPGAPPGWDPARDGECGALPIRVHPAKALKDSTVRVQQCESAWEPTPRELDMLNQGGQIVLRVIGWQPPVALYVEPRIGDDGRYAVTIRPSRLISVPTFNDAKRSVESGTYTSLERFIYDHSRCQDNEDAFRVRLAAVLFEAMEST